VGPNFKFIGIFVTILVTTAFRPRPHHHHHRSHRLSAFIYRTFWPHDLMEDRHYPSNWQSYSHLASRSITVSLSCPRHSHHLWHPDLQVMQDRRYQFAINPRHQQHPKPFLNDTISFYRHKSLSISTSSLCSTSHNSRVRCSRG